MKYELISGKSRSSFGKKSSKAIRREGLVPCVLYGGKEVKHFAVSPKDVRGMVYTPDFKVAKINVDGTEYKCILKDLQTHPVTDELVHLDFLHLVQGATVKTEIPVRFKGVAPGIKSGGQLVQKLRKVKVKTTTEKLVDSLTVSISKLELGSSVRVKDIKVPEGIEIMKSPGIPLASVEVPRALKSAAAEEGAVVAGEEGAAAEGGDAPAAADAPAAEKA